MEDIWGDGHEDVCMGEVLPKGRECRPHPVFMKPWNAMPFLLEHQNDASLILDPRPRLNQIASLVVFNAAPQASALFTACNQALLQEISNVCCQDWEYLSHQSISTDDIHAIAPCFDEWLQHSAHTIMKEVIAPFRTRVTRKHG